MGFLKKLDLPPIWTLLALVFIWLVNRYLPEPNTLGLLSKWIGYVLILWAVYIVIWSFLTFRKFQTTIHPNHKPTKLLQTGPYALSRNPIYLSMVILTLGFAISSGSVYGYFAPIGLFVVLRQRFVEPEEQILIESFGHQGEDYVAKTRRWL